MQARYGRTFSIDAQTGNITTARRIDFSASSSPEIRLVVQATDAGWNSVAASTTVTVRAAQLNLHSPAVRVQSLDGASGLRSFAVPENSPPDSFVAHVLVSDPDFGSAGRVECRLEDDGRHFRLVPLFPPASSLGWQRSAEYKLVSGAVFDRENRSSYQVGLSCRDFGDPGHVTRLTLDVEVKDVDDNRPVFSAVAYNFSIPENNRPGQVSDGQVHNQTTK